MLKQYVVLDFVRGAKFGPFGSKVNAEKIRIIARVLSDRDMAVGTNVKVVASDDDRYLKEIAQFKFVTELDLEQIRSDNVAAFGDPTKAARRPWGSRQIKAKQYF